MDPHEADVYGKRWQRPQLVVMPVSASQPQLLQQGALLAAEDTRHSQNLPQPPGQASLAHFPCAAAAGFFGDGRFGPLAWLTQTAKG